jgi:hypothetical protein
MGKQDRWCSTGPAAAGLVEGTCQDDGSRAHPPGCTRVHLIAGGPSLHQRLVPPNTQ